MGVELMRAERLGSGDHDRHVFGFATGHYGVDRDLLDRHRRVIWSAGTDDLLRVATRTGEHPENAFRRRRNYGKAVGQALIEHETERMVELGSFNRARPQRAAVSLGGQALEDTGLNRFRTASGTQRGKFVPINCWRRQIRELRKSSDQILPVTLMKGLPAHDFGAGGISENDRRND